MTPFFINRLEEIIPSSVTGYSKSITDIYKEHVWLTPSGMLDVPGFNHVKDIIGIDKIIWSCDFPYMSAKGSQEFIDKLEISVTDKNKISFLNASKLFGL